MKPVNLVGNAYENSTALTLVPLETQSLRSHAFHLFIKCVNFLIEPRVLRFRRIAASQLSDFKLSHKRSLRQLSTETANQ